MNTIRCFILDDEPHAIEALCGYVEQTPFLKLAGCSTNGYDALEASERSSFDLIFIDIHMPVVSGLELLKIIHRPAILTTAYSEYAFEGFELDVIDYLLKPITYPRFLKAARKASTAINSIQSVLPSAPEPSRKDYIFVKGGHKGKIVKIVFNDIDYVEAAKNYVVFYTGTGKIMTSMNLREAEELLPADKFMRIHNSYLVQLDRIAAIDGNQAMIRRAHDNSIVALPIGVTYKAKLMAAIS